MTIGAVLLVVIVVGTGALAWRYNSPARASARAIRRAAVPLSPRAQAKAARKAAFQDQAIVQEAARALAQLKADPAAYGAWLALPEEAQAECLMAMVERQAQRRATIRTAVTVGATAFMLDRLGHGVGDSFRTPKVD